MTLNLFPKLVKIVIWILTESIAVAVSDLTYSFECFTTIKALPLMQSVDSPMPPLHPYFRPFSTILGPYPDPVEVR